jgi:type II secretory pathway pseudopilin PulG
MGSPIAATHWVRRVVIAMAVAGVAAAVGVPVSSSYRMAKTERAAADTLQAIADAQRAFRRGGGRGGYAVDVASLTRPCPGDAQAVLDIDPAVSGHDYVFVLRPASGASTAGVDCHGRATTTDFYAAARPAHAWAGRQALATTARGRIYVFFDGIAPLERDMGALGLAVPLDRLDTFKIP